MFLILYLRPFRHLLFSVEMLRNVENIKYQNREQDLEYREETVGTSIKLKTLNIIGPLDPGDDNAMTSFKQSLSILTVVGVLQYWLQECCKSLFF